MGNRSINFFLLRDKRDFNEHVGDINISISFMGTVVGMVAIDFRKLGPSD